jgi:hypothetical protein
MKWSQCGPIDGMDCIKINEPSDPDTWSDNYLCKSKSLRLKLKWSYAGRIENMQCINFKEPAEPQSETWNDNFLCWQWE